MLELSWAVRRPSLPPPTVRLICVPYAGGTSAVFRGWSDLLPDVALGFVELPNRDPRRRSDAAAGLVNLAAAVARLISSTPTDIPCVLFGHSLGALIAFETARRLNDWPALAGLMVSGRRPPAVPSPLSPLNGLPDADFLAAVQERYRAIPAPLLQEPELLALLTPRLRADVTMMETYGYQPGTPLRCPLFVYGGDADLHAPALELRNWAAETTGRCEVRLFDGGHFFLRDSRAALLEALARDLSTCTHEAVRPLGCD